MEQVTVDLTASLSDASAIESADGYIELTESEYNALDKTPFSESSDVKLVTELPAEDTSDDTEEPDTEELGEEGSGEEPGDQDQGQGQQPSEPNPDDSQGTETPPESTEGNKEPDSEDAETEGDSSGDSDNTGVPTTPEDSTTPEDPEPSQDPTESPAAEESAVAPVSASAGEDLSILRESPRGVSAASLTRDGDVGGASRSPAGEPEGTSGYYLSFTLNKEDTQPITATLTFALPEGMDSLDIEVDEEDISLRNVKYASEDTTGEPSIDLTAEDLTLNSAKPEFSLGDLDKDSMEIEQDTTTLPDVTFPFTATVPEGSASYIFQLTLPKGVQLPEENLTVSEDGLSIQAGEDTKVAEVTGLTGATISDPTFTDQTLTFTLTIGEADADLVEEVLNALSDGNASVTFSNLQVDFNNLFGAGNDTKIQLTVTQEPTEDGEVTGTVENSPISIKLTAPQGDAAYEQGKPVTIEQKVTWLDNNNTEGCRPTYGAGTFYPTIKYTITNTTDSTDTESGTLNQSTLAELGFEGWPEIETTSTGFSLDLPKTLTVSDPYGETTYTIEWTFQPPEVECYRLDEGEDNTWTYTLTEDFTFTLAMKRGYPEGTLSNDQVMALLSQFDFQGQTNITGQESASLDLPDFDKVKGLTISAGPDDTYTITIPGLAAYGANNAPLEYWVVEKDSEDKDQVTYDELTECKDTLLPEGEGENGDYYKIAYDNAGVADAGSSTTATYSGGKLTLTLTGVTQYQATKIWLDNGDKGARPDAEFRLWRYPAGTDPSQAAQIRWKDVVEGGDNNFIAIDGEDLIPISEETTEPDTGDEGTTDNDTPATLDGETVTDPSEGGDDATPDEEVTEPEITTQSEFRIEFRDENNDNAPLDLPKYDPDGKRYTYGVREYLTGGTNHYEQVFGEVDPETGEVKAGSDILPNGVNDRTANDTMVYNEGILSNRVTNTATASVTKIWKAAAYQAAFEDVAVEFTLYVRVKGDTNTDEGWTQYEDKDGEAVTCVLHNFSAESMTDSTSQGGLDLYDATGQELEYRWVETAVYQGVDGDDIAGATLVTKAESDDVTGLTTFTLKQTAADGKTSKDVVYQSETKYEGNNRTTVTNSVEDTVDFALAKEWKGVEEEDRFDVTFHIYQTLAGNDFNFDTPYVSVTIPKDEGKVPYLVDKEGTTVESPREDGVTLTSKTEDIDQFNEDNASITPEGFTDWDAIVQNLPLYDETGHLYNYFVLEAAPESGEDVVSPSYERGYYPATGDYSCVITNGPGKQVVLMVQKNWIDDGDALHREPVTVGVYYEKDGKLAPLMDGDKAVTHEINNNTGSWTDFIYIPGELLKDKELKAEDLYIVEQTVGEDAKVTHGNAEDNIPTVDEWTDGHTGTADTDTSIFQVSTDHHRYQVTYEKKLRSENDPAVPTNVDALYVVTNRRLGTVDMTVNKTWVSGQDEGETDGLTILANALNAVNNSEENEKDLALAFQLQFASKKDDWEITNKGSRDTVSVGGEAVSILGADRSTTAPSIQVILGPGTKETNFSFYNLPKYDEQGAVVAYTVEEVWVSRTGDGSWEVLKGGLNNNDIQSLSGLENLKTIWSEYRAAITSQNYTVGSHDVNPGGNAPDEDSTDAVQTILNTNPAGTRRDQDEQHITYTNTRAQTKEVKWYKVWRDNFADQQGNRPDLYLDIYRVVHDKDGQEKIELVTENYRWEVVQPGTTEETETLIGGSSTDVTTGTNAANDVWSVTLHGVDKYDGEGYEIQYFAVERTAVRVSDFDYQAAQYAYSESGHSTTIIGDRDGNATEGSAFGDYTLDLTSKSWKDDDDRPDNIGEFQGSGSQGIAYPRYALLENGTFINTLANSFSVTGMKRWVDLPNGYLSNDPDLPTVTFEVYRSTDAGNIPTDGDPVASLTIESGDWKSMAKSGSSYSFRIDYEGANVVKVDNGVVSFVPADNGTALTPGEDGSYDRNKLPLYDENGNRYYYKATEAITYNSVDTQEETEGGEVQQEDHVYHVTHQDMAGNFTFVNTYAPDVGGLKVKKILSLPADTTADNGGFPSVSFTLKRTYTLSNKEQSKEETVSTLTWTSEQVQEAFAEAKGDATDSTPVLLEHVFEVTGLPIYAPNGSKYVYSIQENTGNLGGYLTYAAEGDVEVSGFQNAETSAEIGNLAPVKVTAEGDEATATEGLKVQATFYNVWEDDQDTVTLSGTKAWQDYGDAMGTRPDLPTTTVTEEGKDPLGLVVKRTANGSKETLELGEDYTVTYEAGENNTWAFKIEGVGDGELEKYATQGVAWTYTVTETLDGNEDMSGYQKASGAWSAKADKEPGEDGSIALGNLTNSLYTNVNFDKVWKGQDDKEITSTYIDFDVEVTFQLQVKAGDGTDWVNASEYFTQNAASAAGKIAETVTGGDEGSPYTATKSGKVYATSAWSGSFQNLPKVIQVGDNLVTLDYRVVETAVKYQDQTQTIGEPNGNQYTVTDPGLVTGAEFTSNSNTSTTTNTLSAISVTVEKKWMDNENQYDTRPNSQGGNMTWESWFVLQRKTEDGETWENVKLVNLYGTNRNNREGSAGTGEKWSETISGLPTMDFANPDGGTYTYRFQELKPKRDGDGNVVGYTEDDLEGDLSAQLVSHNGTYFEAGNKDSFDYEATYSKEDGTVENKQTVTVTNSLYTQTNKVIAKKVWYNENGGTTAPEGASVTVNLMQQIGDGEWTVYQTETLNAANNWTYTWKDLPMYKDNKEVTYQVVEKAFSPDTYINIHNDMSKDADAVTYTFTNVAPTTFSVTKDWVGMETEPEQGITVGLYRTTEEGNIGSTEGTPVPINETDNASPRTATLNAENEWTAEFTGLPKYNEDGDLYHYYALEMSGGEPVAQQGSLNHDGQDYAVDYDHEDGTTIRNIPTTAITGTKNWVDNGNAYGTRPKAEDFQLTLSRSTDGETWTEITDLAAAGIAFTWDTGEEGTNTWTYHFDNLPQYTPEGAAYSYRVTEPDLNAYNGTSDGKEVTSADEGMTGPSFTNTLTGFVTVEGTKTWDDNDNADGTRPNSENFQLTLERTTDEKTWEPVSNATLTWTSTEGNAWTYTFGGNLPLYDEDGVRYTYRVTEADQDAYDVYYTNGSSNVVRQENLCNVARGELTVTKTVTGNRGSWSQDFDFSVTFTLPEGFQDANDLPQISFEKSDGTMGTLEFEDQSLTYTFELHHGQSITFTDLPGGTSYDVDETNSYGHSQSFTGDVGSIPAGEAVTAAFVNHRSGGSWEPDDPTPEDPDDPTPEDPDDPTPEDPEDPTPEDPDDPTPEDPEDPEDPDEPDDPGIDIPEDPTPGVDVPTDPDDPTPEDPDDPDDPDDPGVDIPDDPSPGTDIPDDPTPGTDTPTKPSTPDKDTPNKLPQTGQLWWPVGLLMAAGAALLAAGVLRIRKHHGRDAQK
ncbi:Cna B-type domain-containing protein [Evtepia sp.]